MVDEESLGKVNKALEQVNEYLGGNIKIALVPSDKLDLLEKNAHFMPNETFRQLVENIKKDKQLSSVPFCWKQGERYKVLSGNHRIEAGRQAGVETFLILYTDQELTRSREVSIQISHNALVGRDDQAILKSLYEEIQDIEDKIYTGLDDKAVEALESISIDSLSEIKLEFRTVAFVLLPEEHENLEEVLRSALEQISQKRIYIGRKDDYDRLIKSLGEVQDSYHIKNYATALTGILDVFEANRTDLQDGWMQNDPGDEKREIPVSTLFGTDRIKEAYAITINRALKKAVKAGVLKKENLWELFYKAATQYLKEE